MWPFGKREKRTVRRESEYRIVKVTRGDNSVTYLIEKWNDHTGWHQSTSRDTKQQALEVINDWRASDVRNTVKLREIIYEQ